MQQSRLIFRSRFDRRRWLLVLLGPAIALMLMFDERTFAEAPWAGLVSTAVIAAMLIGASRFDGRQRIAELWLDGRRLTARHYRAIGMGPEVSIAVADISGWEIYRWQNSKQSEAGLRFRHAGQIFRLPLSAADFADLTELQRLSGLDGDEPRAAAEAAHP